MCLVLRNFVHWDRLLRRHTASLYYSTNHTLKAQNPLFPFAVSPPHQQPARHTMSPLLTPPIPPLVSFYDPEVEGSDHGGRTLFEILSWGDSKLESRHDYIQILFPLPEGSPFNPEAPIIDRATFNSFHSRPELRRQQRLSFLRMTTFYGFEYPADGEDASEKKLVQAPHHNDATRRWVMRFNHNHLRCTRIIRSLRVLGLEKEARDFFEALENVFEKSGRISGRSMDFWRRAMERPLYIAPEDEEDR